MRPRSILLSVSAAMLLAGCAASDRPPIAAAPVQPEIPPLPADIRACMREPVMPPDRALNAGEVERLWATDRAALSRVNGCLARAVCQYQDVRSDIAGAVTATCDAAKPGPVRRGLFKRKVAAR